MGSTVFTRGQARELERSSRPISELLQALQRGTAILDLEKKNYAWADEIMPATWATGMPRGAATRCPIS